MRKTFLEISEHARILSLAATAISRIAGGQ
jgi:hypothetical protein